MGSSQRREGRETEEEEMNALTPKDIRSAIDRLKALQKSDDTEAAHSDADDIICELLARLGHKEIVDEYHRVPKWFA